MSDELLALVRDRRHVTAELHQPNDYYGQAAVLKRYAGLPQARALKVAIEHGIMVEDLVWGTDRNTGMPVHLCPSPRRAAIYEEHTRGEVRAVPVGPPIAYAGGAEGAPPSAGGPLLAFPAHSTHHIDVRYDAEAFAGRLDELRGDWPDVEVCLYWRDVLLGTHAVYERHGFRCVTAGHMFDHDFLPRLRALILGSAAIVTNQIGTHIPYAVVLGRPAGILEQEVGYAASAEVLERDMAREEEHERFARLRELFLGPPERAISPEQQEFIDELAGTAHVRSPAELAAILAEAEELYRRRTPASERAWRAFKARVNRTRNRARRWSP